MHSCSAEVVDASGIKRQKNDEDEQSATAPGLCMSLYGCERREREREGANREMRVPGERENERAGGRLPVTATAHGKSTRVDLQTEMDCQGRVARCQRRSVICGFVTRGRVPRVSERLRQPASLQIVLTD